jgi:hypothetical protein
MTPVANYGESCAPNHASYGFCDKDSKTDNFKVRNANAAYVAVCKFNDLNANGIQDSEEPFIPFWPITATGVDTLSGPIGTVTAQTDATGCVSFSVSNFSTVPPGMGGVVTLTEGFLVGGWQQTAPADAPYIVPDGVVPPDADTVTVNVATNSATPPTNFETLTLTAGDSVNAPNFGNTCLADTCGGNTVELTVTKDANPSFTRTFTWGISKSVDTKLIDTNGNGATFNYTVNLTHDNGADSGWQVTGNIKVSNPSLMDITGVSVVDSVSNGGTCSITYGPNGDGSGLTVPAKSKLDVPYTCTYGALPTSGTNYATASWDSSNATGTASIDFSSAVPHVVDGSVTVTDPLDPNSPHTVSSTDPSPTTFNYSHTFTGDPAGTCTPHKNTATFTTSDTKTTGSDSQTVKDCQGADLTVGKTASTSFTRTYNWKISKSASWNGKPEPSGSTIQESGGTVSLSYSVTATETGFTDSGWTVSGTITVTNPNDWEDFTGVTLSDSLGAGCTITLSTLTVNRSSSATASYSCPVGSAASGTNYATANWTGSSTPDTSATGPQPTGAPYSFSSTPTTTVDKTVTMTDTYKGTLSPSLTATDALPYTTNTWTYTRTVTIPPGTCTPVTNTATVGTTVTPRPSATVNLTICNEQTGGLTMGFWKNTNGQGIIKKSCGGTSGTSLYAFLSSYNPFKDDTNSSCSIQATYVYNIINKATCSTGGYCNTMLRAQMLATALDVYFSTSSLGGNQIGAYNGLGTKTPALGTVAVDLSHICNMIDGTSGSSCSGAYEDSRPEFGILAPCLGTTVGQMLSYSNFLSSVNGSPVATATTGANWYLQNKTKQVFAKDGFDNFNNQIVNIAPTSCGPTF